MKEKITLFIALSFLVGLTVYKKSFDNTVELASDIQIENEQNDIKIEVTDDTNLVSDDELKDSTCDSNEVNTDALQFSEAFKYFRNCNHDTFIWNGVEYTTILKSEINQNLEENHNLSSNKMDLVVK